MESAGTAYQVSSGINKSPCSRNERLWLLIFVLLSLVIHGYFLFEGFGEPDAARIAISTMLYKVGLQGGISRINPCYQTFLWGCLNLGLPSGYVPTLMNGINLIVGSLTLIPLYLLWRSLSSPMAAALACLLYSAAPAFWVAHLYGMPHLPAFFFLLWAVLIYSQSLEEQNLSFFIKCIGALGLMFLALGCKMDVALYSGAFLGLLVVAGKWNLRNCIAAVLIPGVALGLVVFYIKLLSPSHAAYRIFPLGWHEKWPTDLTAFKSWIPVGSVGVLFFDGIVFASIYSLLHRPFRKYAILAVFWAAPAGLFWCSRWGNSVRHLMIADSVLIFLMALVLLYLCRNIKTLSWCVVVGIFLNYLLMPADEFSINKGGRFLKTYKNVQAFHNKIRQKSAELSLLTLKEVTLLGEEDIPFVIWEMMVRCKIKDIKDDISVSYCFFNQKQKLWNDGCSTGYELMFEDRYGNRKIIRTCPLVLPIVILNDPARHYWTCRDRVILIDDPSKIVP